MSRRAFYGGSSGGGGSSSPTGWGPTFHGYKAWTVDPGNAAGSATVTAGTLNLARLYLPTAASITNLHLHVVTASATLTAGSNFAALYTAAGARIDVTADQATAWASIGVKSMALAGGPYAAAAGEYYVAWWAHGGTPAFLRGGNSSAVNAGLSAPNFRFATANTGLTTTAPATLGTQTISGSGWFAAVS